ncbi:serine/threonine-protein kinase [Aeromicrobium panaciterrae]|uniref:non-specific serine/threonine protein kinase n=1 Tax=Aeromicrobium panaciterrae TaxID=363861 RepID=A0ABU1UN78_9ACTN|nr:protein kinase [Aeromicrobium panaciterrae]MDR7086637.1 serine/threonine-protein kinase [Aeromicrobium panaciterrae]
MPATLSDRYRLDALIGDGGMGEVWKAHDPVLDRVVAVKVIRSHLAGDLRIRERLRTEAQLAGSLRHPGIVDVFDYGEHVDVDGRTTPYLVMPLVDGTTLSEVLSSRGSLPLGETMKIVAEMASALQTAHGAGIVHRDLKPANVMLTASGRVMILDFGIARSTGGESLTQTGAMVGTADYLSPEQAAGHPATYASDLYALGIVAYTCLTGAPPFRRDTDVGTALAHLHEPVPPLPSELSMADPLIRSLLSKEPTHRPSAGDVAAIAGTMATSLPTTSKSSAEHTRTDLAPLDRDATATIDIVDTKRRRPRKALWIGAAMLALVGVLIGGFAYANRPVKIAVPNVVGMSSVEAASTLGRSDLTVETHETNVAGHKTGEVIKQSVKPGTEVGEDALVSLTVATGLFSIPGDLVGKPYDEVAATLEDLGLTVNKTQKLSQEESDTVLSVEPSTLAKAGDTITVTVSYSFFDFDFNGDDDDKGRDKKHDD